MSVLRAPAFFRAYRFFPHRLLNGAARALTTVERPRWAVDLAVRAWVRRDRIDLADFEARRWSSLEDFFLRRLRPGARPIGEGLVSPADGVVVSSGTLERGTILQVKGKPISVDRLVHGGRAGGIDLAPFEGGAYVTVFLTPRGYHYVHMPLDGTLRSVRWVPGRFFPQNEDALQHVDAIYERNERAVLQASTAHGEIAMVLVGASLIGGIHLRDVDRSAWVRLEDTTLAMPRAKGEEIAHFSFGSTVVMLLPRGFPLARCPEIGRTVRMGEPL